MINKIKEWYKQLTAGIQYDKEGNVIDVVYSLSDTQFFWITIVWLILLPCVTYAVFWLGLGTWKEYLVFVVLEIVVLAFKYAKYINVKHGSTSVEMTKEE